jgi:queuine tRNA-ribosyltransferase
MSRELRKRSAEGLIKIGFDGYGFGARHVDTAGQFLQDIVAYTASLLPEDKPRFALGVGTPEDIVRCARMGWDMFDCVIPTREGRHGRLFIWNKQFPNINSNSLILNAVKNLKSAHGQRDPSLRAQDDDELFYRTINITNEQFKEDFAPVDQTCDCPLCQNYSRAYLRHLFAAGEPLSGRLASIHNLRFYGRLMQLLQGK